MFAQLPEEQIGCACAHAVCLPCCRHLSGAAAAKHAALRFAIYPAGAAHTTPASVRCCTAAGSQTMQGEAVGFETEATAIMDTMAYIRPDIYTLVG